MEAPINGHIKPINDEINDARNAQRLSIPAKRLKEKLEPIPSKVEFLQKRWFWELLQNASDYNDEVDVRLEIYDDKLTFSHNGLPFRPIDTENLIAPDSGKDDLEMKDVETIGQYGTGFISTHVLSAKITIEGIIKSKHVLDTYYKFNFHLDRSGFNDKELLKDSILKAEEQLDNNLIRIDYRPGNFNSKFIYDLNTSLPDINVSEVVREGLKNITDVLPYTLSFLQKVKSVEIINESSKHGKFLNKKFSRSSSNNQLQIVYFEKNHDSEKTDTINLRKFSNDSAESVIRIEKGRLLPYPNEISKLFCSLPLIGTSSFSFPVILNSPNFRTTNERDGIELSNNDTINRNILSSGITLFKNLANELSIEGVKDLYHISHWKELNLQSLQAKSWFTPNILDNLQLILLDTKIVDSSIGPIKLNDTIIPYIEKENYTEDYLSEFYDLLKHLFEAKLPIKEDYLKWYEVLDFRRFKKQKCTIIELAEWVSSKGSLVEIKNDINNVEGWINLLIKFIIKYNPDLLTRYNLIPNREGELFKQTDNIYWDDEIPEGLIEVYNEFTGKNFEKRLLDRCVETIEGILPKEKSLGVKDIASKIDTLFKENRESIHTTNGLKSLELLFKWFRESGLEENELKRLFDYFSRNKPQLFMNTFSEEQREKAFSIVQSGKFDLLSRLSDSPVSKEDLEQIIDNQDEYKSYLKWREKIVDDVSFANEYEGKIGEAIVYSDLVSIFHDADIIWASRDHAIEEYDFEVKKNGISIYIDAKTTNQGIANSDSIPFFVRTKQWEFLESDATNDNYYVARVFINGSRHEIKYLKLDRKEINIQ